MRLQLLVWLAASSLLAGCSQGKGDDSSIKQCVLPMACGGDLVGSWQVDSVCFGSSFQLGDCQKTVDSSQVSVQNSTITYNGDGTYSSSFTYSGTYLETYPASCLAAGSTCSDLAAMLGYGCSPAADGSCVCSVATSGAPSQELGSYTVMDTTLLLSSTLGQQTTQFCVRNGQLSEAVDNQAGELVMTLQLSLP